MAKQAHQVTADRYHLRGIRRSGKKRVVVDLELHGERRNIAATGSPDAINRAVPRLLDALGDDLTLEELAAALADLTIVE